MKIWVIFLVRIEELTEALDEKEKIRLIVKEREDKIETLNKNIDENDKVLQELESRFDIFSL